MSATQLVEGIAILGPIVALIAIGFAITLRSGVAGAGTGQGLRLVAANLSRTLVILIACLVCLAVLQLLVGFRLRLV
jgi:hypothetical protein